MRFISIASVLLLTMVAHRPAWAGRSVILVAPRDTPEFAVAESKEDGQHIFAERKLYKAFAKAAEILNQPGPQEVRVFVGEGEYTGQMGQGQWTVPPISNPEGKLYILGGWTKGYKGRQPFQQITRLVTAEGRPGPMIHFSKNSVLKELAISGLLMDAKPSNEYDARSNSLKISASQTYTLLGFNLLKVDRLTVADNIFINGSHGTVEPYIYPMSNETVVTFQNNFFINNRFPTSTKGRTYKGAKVKELNFVHNSFILNWPLNPDPTSSNVGVINLYTQDCCGQFTLEGNLFAFNPGGAMQQDHLWERMPNTRIRNNLFYMNAMLFEKDASDAGVIVGKFGLNPSYLIADLEMLEDEFDYDVSGNVSMDPQLPLTFPDLLAVDSNDVSRQNSSMNDVRQLFGMNQQGGRVAIANYAPAVPYNRPFPQNEGAKKFGVQPTALYPVP